MSCISWWFLQVFVVGDVENRWSWSYMFGDCDGHSRYTVSSMPKFQSCFRNWQTELTVCLFLKIWVWMPFLRGIAVSQVPPTPVSRALPYSSISKKTDCLFREVLRHLSKTMFLFVLKNLTFYILSGLGFVSVGWQNKRNKNLVWAFGPKKEKFWYILSSKCLRFWLNFTGR